MSSTYTTSFPHNLIVSTAGSSAGSAAGSFVATDTIFTMGETTWTVPVTTFTSTTIGPGWQPTGGCTTMYQDLAAQAGQWWLVPDHFFESDVNGGCANCQIISAYRFSPDAHAPIIKEEPEQDDWWQLLAS